MIPFFLFVFGLIIGSFLNAVIYRLRRDESFVRGRSRCPHCRHVLNWPDLVPVVSWALLGGRCRYCPQKISVQYPLVELATAFAFLLLGTQYQTSHPADIIGLLAGLIVTALLVIIFVYDFKHYIIPDIAVWPLAAVAAMSNLLLGWPWWNLVLGAVIGAGFFWLQYVVSQGRWIGFGDVKLGLAMGLLLGWPYITVALMLAYLLGSLIGIVLIAFGQKQMTSQVPFATFLTTATFVTLIYGTELWQWYQRLILFP